MDRRTRIGSRVGSTVAPSRGFALLASVVAVAAVTLATAVPLQNLRFDAQRERERELLFIGSEFADAIGSYRAASPGGVPTYPETLQDLVEDKRFPSMRRHLRRIYADPMTGRADWELILDQGRIIGIASNSQREPLRRAKFPRGHEGFATARGYHEWRFVAQVSAPRAAAETRLPAAAPLPDRRGGPIPGPTPPGTSDPWPPPQPPAPRPPNTDPAPPPPDTPRDSESLRQAQCLSAFAERLNGCHGSPVSAAACRAEAREALRACMERR